MYIKLITTNESHKNAFYSIISDKNKNLLNLGNTFFTIFLFCIISPNLCEYL